MSIAQPKTAYAPEGTKDIPQNTEGFTFNHTMLRIKNPKTSLAFYTGVLGMTVVDVRHFDDFSLYFLGKLTQKERDTLPKQDDLRAYVSQARGILELTHNHGSEDDDTQYHSGNEEPKGFGHICFSVPNLEEAVAHFDANQVPFQKRPEEGNMNDIAFIKDPDGYWIEIIEKSVY